MLNTQKRRGKEEGEKVLVHIKKKRAAKKQNTVKAAK
jgi:hypothetical protein